MLVLSREQLDLLLQSEVLLDQRRQFAGAAAVRDVHVAPVPGFRFAASSFASSFAASFSHLSNCRFTKLGFLDAGRERAGGDTAEPKGKNKNSQ